jgi:hypothetical protein
MPEELNIGAKIETPEQTENTQESGEERPDLKLEKQESVENKKIERAEEKIPTARTVAAQPAKSAASEYEERAKLIEGFLARGLEDIYLGLPLDKQKEFRDQGEETAKKINKLLEKTKVNIGKIVSLIIKWLSLIPGVNKFFLEQEAKIKADEIIKLKNRN